VIERRREGYMNKTGIMRDSKKRSKMVKMMRRNQLSERVTTVDGI